MPDIPATIVSKGKKIDSTRIRQFLLMILLLTSAALHYTAAKGVYIDAIKALAKMVLAVMSS